MQRQLANPDLTTDMRMPTRLVASRRGCSTEIIESKDEDSSSRNLVHIFRADPSFQERMTMLRNKLAQIEIQSQLMEISLLAHNREQFTKSAECLCQLADGIPSRNLLRSAIRAQLISSSTPEHQLAELIEEISFEIRSLKTELGS